MAISQKEEELLKKWKIKEWKAKNLEKRERLRELRAKNLERVAKSKVRLIEGHHGLRAFFILLIIIVLIYVFYRYFVR